MNLDPKVQRIIEWRESLTVMPDKQFFDIVRMYLGDVRTPYNKQALVEDLGAFIRKEEHKQMIVKLLSDTDIKILTVIHIVPDMTPKKLQSFFLNLFSFTALCEYISNLEERLLIYSRTDKLKKHTTIALNPLLEEALLPYLRFDALFSDGGNTVSVQQVPRSVNPLLLTAFVAYILENPQLCKGNGELKKRNATELEAAFGSVDALQTVLTAFVNLNVLTEDGKRLRVDWKRLSLFASLPSMSLYPYLCVASVAKFFRGSLQFYAQLLFSTLRRIPEKGFTRQEIIWLMRILYEQNGGSSEFFQRRTYSFLSETVHDSDKKGDSTTYMEGIIDSCLKVGLLYVAGTDAKGNDTLAVAPLLWEDRDRDAAQDSQKVLSIDAAFGITVLPGLPFAKILPLARYVHVVRYDTAAVFEITKQSAMRGFDSGMNPEDIIANLSLYCAYEVPQNLRLSIEEWYHSYASASLYRGYVLKIAPEKAVLVEKSYELSRRVVEVLAPGVFLLNFANDDEAKHCIMRSRLDFVGTIKIAEPEKHIDSLLMLQEDSPERSAVQKDSEKKDVATPRYPRASEQEQTAFLEDLESQVLAMKLPSEQCEGLLDRIRRKVVVNPTQLRGMSVRFEKVEAGGMDYTGKLHVIEGAILNKNFIELVLDSEENVLVGRPLALSKRMENAEASLALITGEQIVFSVGAAIRVKKLRTSFMYEQEDVQS